MIQIIPNRQRNLANDLLQGVGGALQGILGAEEMQRNRSLEDEKLARQKLLQQREDQAYQGRGDFLRQNLGEGAEYISDDLAKTLMQGLMKGQPENKPSKEFLKYTEASEGVKSALNTIDDLRGILKKKTLGVGSEFFSQLGGEVSRDFGDYQTGAKSLIKRISNIPITNKAEFETLAGDLIDPSIPLDKSMGILNRLEKLLREEENNYKKLLSLSSGKEMVEDRPHPSQFMRK